MKSERVSFKDPHQAYLYFILLSSSMGKHAHLIPLEEAHIPALYETRHDPILWQYSALLVASLEDMHQLVRSALAGAGAERSVAFSIFDLRTEQIVGSTQFHTHPSGQALSGDWTNACLWGIL